MWLSGSRPGAADEAASKALKESGEDIDVSAFPYTFAWFSLAAKFAPHIFAASKPAAPKAEANARHEELDAMLATK
jgi:hypothetical protein